MKKPAKSPIDRGAPASVIADRFGGLVKFCEALTEARRARDGDESTVAPSTVHRWLVKGVVPFDWIDLVNAAAEHRRVRIKPTDYIDSRPVAERGVMAEATA